MDFVQDNKVDEFPMLWDPSGQSWTALGLVTQPAWMVVAPDGKLSSGSLGRIDEALVVEIANAFAADPAQAS